jgi:hypothetical protein
LSSELGVFAVDVRAIDEPAKAFYSHYGFLALNDNPLHLYLPITTIEKLFPGDGAP